MDYTRISLIAGLAIVSYLLLLAWNEDHPQQVTAPVESISMNGSSLEIDDLPAVSPPSTSASSEDIPSVSQDNTRPASATPDRTGLVRVHTPLQRVAISLEGGDIVELSLPDFPVSLDRPDEPFVLMRQDNQGVYVAQSGLVGRNGIDGGDNGRARFTASSQEFHMGDGQEQLSVDLNYVDNNGIRITKRYTFHRNDYLVNVEYLINNQSSEEWRGNLFGQIKRDASEDPSKSSGFGMGTYLGAVLTTDEDPYKKLDFGDIDKRSSNDVVRGGWIGFSQHYFLGAWVPSQEMTHTYSTHKNTAGEYLMRFVSPETVVSPGSSTSVSTSFWAGPKDQYRLKEIAENLNLTIDYGWLWFVAQPIFWLLTKIDSVIGNFGWSIIALTIVIKMIFFKLSSTSYRSMAKMRKLTPKIQQLRDRHGEDKQKLMQAQMELWKKEKVNPMGGCLPMLVQMPVLIGIYWVLMESVELRHAEWILWYKDLSAMDPYFILPLLMGASMFVSQMMTPMMSMDPLQQKMMRLMPVFFTVFFLWFPAGLVLYWLVSNIFNIVHQWTINRQIDAMYAGKAN